MRYALSNWIYADEPLAQTFRRLARSGYEGVELAGEPERLAPDEVRRLCRDHGIRVTSVLGWSIFGIPGRDLASPDRDERLQAVRYGRACVDLAAAVEAPILVVIPAAAGRTAPAGRPAEEKEWLAAYQEEWKRAVDSVRQAAEYAASHGVTLGIEPINRYETFLVTDLDRALSFLEDVASEAVKIHLDTFHMNLEEPDPANAIRRAGPRLVNLHASDSNRQAPGRGHIDFLAILEALREIGYGGVLTLEPVPPGSDPLLAARMSRNLPLRDVYAEEGIRFLRSLEAKLGAEA
ncbi:MAG: sugar phosphate isomerase/epimerase family protein [Anaerolineales bacterium]